MAPSLPLDIVTFGCRLNAFESEAIRRHAEAAGLDDAIIVNTCAVTAEAERQARQTIRKLRRERPDARLIVTGCAAQIDPARFAAMPEVDTVLGNAEKMRAESYRDFPRALPPATFSPCAKPRRTWSKASTVAPAPSFRYSRAATIAAPSASSPIGRGASRSVPVADAIAQARLLVERGYRELVLTGVDITAYEREFAGPSWATRNAPGAGPGIAAPAFDLARSGGDRRGIVAR